MNIFITGAYTTKFGELWDSSPRALAQEAANGALSDANLEARDIDAMFVGNMLSGMLGGQEHLGSFFSESVGIEKSSVKIEGACASGGLAIHQGILAVLSGMYKTVLVLGVEKMTDHKPEDVAIALMGAGSDEERRSGITFPGLYAQLARIHMHQYGTTQAQLASVAVKNHFHAHLNPKAQFHNLLSIETVLKSSKIADPLTLLDCSPISDGAAAVVITSLQRKKHDGVRVLASAVSTDSLGLAQRSSLTELAATVRASGKAYAMAGISPSQIQVAEVHDCFSIAEILAMEDLGFVQKGQGGAYIESGETTLGQSQSVVVNSSGGLKGCGHPVGATGVKQIVEIVDQLRGCAEKRQVKDATIGLTHNVGGSGATAVVHILTNQ